MKKFISTIVVFFLPIIAIVIILELTILEKKQNIFSEEALDYVFYNSHQDYEWIYALNNDSLILLTGSSSVRFGLSCSILNDLSKHKFAYVNLAHNARDPIETYFILKYIKFDKVKEIYFGLAPWIYTKRYYRHRNTYLYQDLSSIEALKFLCKIDRNCLQKRYKGFFNFAFNPLKGNNNGNYILDIPDDFGSVVLNREALNFNPPIGNSFQTLEFGWSDLQYQYLFKIAELCKEKNVSFTVFIPPKRSDYSAVYKSILKETHNGFISNLIDVNFSAQIFGTFNQLDNIGDDRFFTDAYHLNSAGQEKYSEIFFKMQNGKKDMFSKDYQWFSQK